MMSSFFYNVKNVYYSLRLLFVIFFFSMMSNVYGQEYEVGDIIDNESIGSFDFQDTVSVESASFYIIKKKESFTVYYLVTFTMFGYKVCQKSEYFKIAFLPIRRYCFCNNSVYDMEKAQTYKIKMPKGDISEITDLFNIEGDTPDKGHFISNGYDIFFSDGTHIAPPFPEYELLRDSVGQLKVCLDKDSYQISDENVSSCWKVRSFMETEDSIGDYYIRERMNDTTLIVLSPNKKRFSVLQLSENSTYIETHFPEVTDVKYIKNSNGRFYLCQKSDTCSYIYDCNTEKMTPTIYNKEGKNYESLIYLGNRNNEPVFHDYEYDMLGLDGFFAEIDAEGTGLDFENLHDDKICFSDITEETFRIPLRKIPQASRLIFDLDNYYKDNVSYTFRQNRNDSISNHVDRISLSICVPKLQKLDKIKKHVLYWIADCYAASKGLNRLHNIVNYSTENKLIKDIEDFFVQNEVEDFKFSSNQHSVYENHDECFNVCLLYQTNKYASFMIEYYIAGEIRCSYAATFDIERNCRLVLSDIITDEGKSQISEILKKYYYKNLKIGDYVMPVILRKNGLQFFIGEREPSFEATNNALLSGMDSDPDFAESLSHPFIPYSMIDEWLKVDIDSVDYSMGKVSYYFTNIRENEGQGKANVKIQKSIGKENEEVLKYDQEFNDGYNRNYAKRIQNEFPKKSSELYSKLWEEYHTTIGGDLLRNNYLYSNILQAEQYYKEANYDAVDSICQKALNMMPVDTARILTTNYYPYLLNNMILGADFHTFSDSIYISGYSTEEGYNPYIDALILLAKTRQAQGDFESAMRYFNQSQMDLLGYLRRRMPLQSKDKKNTIWQHYRDFLLSDLLQEATRFHRADILKGAYESQLFGKGLLLNSEVAMIKYIMNSDDEIAKQNLSEYLRIQDEIEKCRRLSQHQKMVELQIEQTDVYYRLMENIAFSNFMVSQNISLEQVSKNLKTGEVAIEFADVKENSDRVYYAMILFPNDSIPTAIRLCTNKDLKALTIDDISNGNLYNILWKPVEHIIKPNNTIFFSPSATLHSLAIESAVNSKTGLRMNDQCQMYRLSSTREIVLARDTVFKHHQQQGKIGLLIGGLDYNSKRDFKPESTFSDNSEVLLFRGGLHFKKFKPLPFTKDEIENIQPYIKDIMSVDSVVTLVDKSGTETAFRYYSRLPICLLHIATHGFYLSDDDYMKLDGKDYLSLLGKNYRDIEEKGLIRSGLLFAGVNHVLNHKDSQSDDDGIMTAMEISTMGLNGVDLAVLSACQTASGEISDDGVIGLQRGFKKAGVNSIVMSLWTVDDDATCVFMTKFYEHLATHHDKQGALNAAQKYLQESAKYKDPKHWAAFVLLDGIR